VLNPSTYPQSIADDQDIDADFEEQQTQEMININVLGIGNKSQETLNLHYRENKTKQGKNGSTNIINHKRSR
jgi:hypothetical protein